ncbi:hypothetical protein, partial [Alloacidobacterium sp.]|uniref:hypothetical protein n=1 Tax=Alloacidobacterium sp. TaxID=2951999 RepID=UPI002D54E920
MKRICALVICFLFTMNVLAADNGYKVMYDGGSVQALKSGSKAQLFIESNQIRLNEDGKDAVVI